MPLPARLVSRREATLHFINGSVKSFSPPLLNILKTMKKEITRVDVGSVALMYGGILASIGLFLGIIFALFGSMFSSMSNSSSSSWMMMGGGIAVAIFLPIIYGIIGAIFGAVFGVVYNFIAGRIGGVKVYVRD